MLAFNLSPTYCFPHFLPGKWGITNAATEGTGTRAGNDEKQALGVGDSQRLGLWA
jgi:hypothetical protein